MASAIEEENSLLSALYCTRNISLIAICIRMIIVSVLGFLRIVALRHKRQEIQFVDHRTALILLIDNGDEIILFQNATNQTEHGVRAHFPKLFEQCFFNGLVEFNILGHQLLGEM